jgi:hypothetical protein
MFVVQEAPMRSDSPSPLAAISAPRPDRDTLLPLLRWLILGAALGLCVLALSHADRVGAAAPANCIPINQTSCLSNGVIYTNGTATTNIGLPGSTVIPGYAVPFVGYPSYGYGSYVGANFLPYYGGNYGVGYGYGYPGYGYLGTNCDPKAWWCLNYEYTGDVFSNVFVPGPNGIAVPNTPAPAPSAPAGATYTPREVAQPAVATAAPVAAPQAAPVSAPTAQMATALTMPTQATVPDTTTSVKIMAVQAPATPAASTSGRDDHT